MESGINNPSLFGYVLDRFRKETIICTALLLLSSLLDAIGVVILAPIVDLVLQAAGSEPSGGHFVASIRETLVWLGVPNSIWAMVAFFMMIVLVRNVVMVAAWNRIVRTQYRVMESVLNETFSVVLHANWSFFTRHKQGVFISAFTREVPRIASAFSSIAYILSGIIQACIFLLVPLWISWRVTLACSAFALLALIPVLALGRLNQKWGRTATDAAGVYTGIVQESFSLAKLLHAFGNQRYSTSKLADTFRGYRTAMTRSQTLKQAVPLIYHPVGLIGLLFAYIVAQRTALPLAEFGVILYALWKVLPVLANVAGVRSALMECLPAFDTVIGLRQEAAEGPVHTGDLPFAPLAQSFCFDHVSFSYPETPAPVLRDISIEVPRGSFCALVGPSGAGKTTIVDLLLGFYAPTEGRVLLDGKSLSDIDLQSYRARTAYVPQESALFDATIRENLLWANSNATEDELTEALNLANANEFVSRLPKKLDTIVGDRGYRLSGGQVQRLALARALLRKPDILILDEATSALDTESEQLIQQSIESLGGQLTVVVIAHRLSTITRADIVYVLEDGVLLESGSFSELSTSGRFQEMLTRQGVTTNE